MTRKKRGRKKRWRRKNPGWFKKGTDARRHIFTPQDCRMGWWVANVRHPELRDWLRMKLFCYLSSKARKEKTNGQATNGRGTGRSAARGDRLAFSDGNDS